MGGAYSYLKPQGFLDPAPVNEPHYGSANYESISSGPARLGSAMPVLFPACSDAAITNKSPADQIYDEQDQQKNAIEKIRKRETKWFQWMSRWHDPTENFGDAVKREFAAKVVPYVEAEFKTWDEALEHFGVQKCNGPRIITKKRLAGLLGSASVDLMSLDAAAATLIFLGTGRETAQALTAEQLEAMSSQLTPAATWRAQPR